MSSFAEKFQITIPAKEENGEEWVTAESQRVHTGITKPDHGEKFNRMPVGYDATSEKDKFVTGFGGNTDVTNGITAKSLERGYLKHEMKATDDQYSGEHVDLFYGDSGGCVERNNYMDRL